MFPFNTFNQIQMWPSPNFWEGHKLALRTLPEFANANIALSLFVQVVPVDNSVTELGANSVTILTKWDNGGPAGDRTLQDDTLSNVNLSTFINFTAVDNSVTDTANSDTQLTLFNAPTPIDQNFTEPTNSNIALTKWQQ